jgi:4-carboxymuconolactone decarboxylase
MPNVAQHDVGWYHHGAPPPAGRARRAWHPLEEAIVAEDLYSVGMQNRRKVLGDTYVDNATKNVDDFNRDFQKMVTEYCWGGIWGREGLSHKQRSLNNLCILAALNRMHEFELHFRGAIRNGCTVDEIRETLLQIAVYAGIPAGVEVFRIGRRVLAEEGVTP